MAQKRITLVGLRVTGPGRPAAEVGFAPGLNVMVGASDTGKTFIFETIDFMLGAGKAPRRLPESNGYDSVFLDVNPSGGAPITLRRAFEGGDFLLEEFGGGRGQAATAERALSARHGPDPDRSLSAYLLRTVGLLGREVRKNKEGEKTALSFRDVCHLTLVDEERIIKQGSPVLSGQYTTKTRERNVFAFFLTGQDDSQIITAEDPADDQARRDTEVAVLEALLADKVNELAGLSSSPDELPAQVSRLEQAIADLSRAVVTSKEQIGQLERRRSELMDDRTRAESRLIFVEEQLKRFRLLDDYYISDRGRLQAVLEAHRVYHELPEGVCPLCNRQFDKADGDAATSHLNFEDACRQELRKIEALARELQVAISDFATEQSILRNRLSGLGSELARTSSQLEEVLAPGVQLTHSQLQEVIQQRTAVAQADALRATVADLQRRIEGLTQVRVRQAGRPNFEERATTSAAFDFCRVVEQILRAWRYPQLGNVSFDTAKADLVIGGQDRANKGKGYRALTQAAFTIGLMKYCRQKGIPHPGVVVLDTPLNPFKGPQATADGERVSDEVKVAFYEYLANDTSGDQVIIIENEEPPAAIRDRVKYHMFTKNVTVGRYGFFPVTAPEASAPPPST